MPATPRKTKRFGKSAAHQRLMMANLAASLFAAEAIVTTEAKAKALRPIAEKLITKAKKAQEDDPQRVHRIRQIQGYLGDKEMTHKLVSDVAPRYADRNGGYTRILKLGQRPGDGAPMARIELVESDPPRDIAWVSVTGVDQRGDDLVHRRRGLRGCRRRVGRPALHAQAQLRLVGHTDALAHAGHREPLLGIRRHGGPAGLAPERRGESRDGEHGCGTLESRRHAPCERAPPIARSAAEVSGR